MAGRSPNSRMENICSLRIDVLRAVYKRKKSPNRLFSFIDAGHLHLNNCHLARAYEIGLT